MFARASGTRAEVSRAAGAGASIELYDEIGIWGVTAKDFKALLTEAGPGDLTVRINSPGGDVFDGIAMYNDLVAHPGKVKVEIVGLAASAASVVAMAGDQVVIAPSAFLMIHNAWSFVVGNRHALNEFAAVLAKIDGALAKVYAEKSGRGMRTMAQMMDAETWLTGQEAVDMGLANALSATEEIPALAAEASFDLSIFAKCPKALQHEPPMPMEPVTVRDAERRLMRDAGYSRSQARAALISANVKEKTVRDGEAAAILQALTEFARRVSVH
jgi:ATP-dependent protease ClpP protease subunit